jgi:hypothetical protein
MPGPMGSGGGIPRWAPFTVRARTEEACTRFAKSYCARAAECSALETRLRFGDVAECARQTALWCAREMEAPDSGISPATLSACGRAVVERPCRRWRRHEDLPVPACHPSGGRTYRSPCLSGAQCVSGFCAHAAVTSDAVDGRPTVCGTCAPVAGANDVCAGPSLPFSGCPPGSLCSRGICIGPFVDEGDPCGVGAWYTDCYGTFPQDSWVDSHLVCDATQVHPVCRRTTRPVFCTTSPDNCWNEDYCNPTTGRCEPKVLVAIGEPCDATRNFCAGGVCGPRCSARKRPGAPCTAEDDCEWPAACVDGACLVVDAKSCDGSSGK